MLLMLLDSERLCWETYGFVICWKRLFPVIESGLESIYLVEKTWHFFNSQEFDSLTIADEIGEFGI
jgi:hypothetical protein